MVNQTSSDQQPARVFLSYAHADELLLTDLRKHLAALKRQNVISTWHDRDISAGSDWAGAISQELEDADAVLLLISPDFIASDYCSDVETRRAMERHDAGEALVIPIFLRPCDWKGEVFGKLQGLPTDARPITGPSWSSHDEAFAVVASGIRSAIVNWRQRNARFAGSTPSQAVPPSPTPPAQTPPAYKLPKQRSAGFNPYQANREILAFLEEDLAARMATFLGAGYVVDHDNQAGRVRFRVLSGDKTIYFLDIWQGGLGGSDKGLSFYHGWGNRSGSDNSTTATAEAVPDEDTGAAKMNVLNMSLLGHEVGQKTYTKEEFVDTLWEQVVTTVDQLGRH